MSSPLQLWTAVRQERTYLCKALAAVLLNAALSLSTPVILAYAIDTYIMVGDYAGVLRCSAVLLAIFLTTSQVHYRQTLWMGTVGQRLLYRLRQQLFEKLQALPLAFFQQNQTGDLISRLNNDTDRVNQFFSQSLVQFSSSLITMAGAGIFLLALHPRLGAAALIPALAIVLPTRALGPWIRSSNAASLKSTGDFSAEISECLDHFKVLVAFERRDYFRERLEQANRKNYRKALLAGLANGIFTPIYGLCSQMAQFIVLGYGLWLVSRQECTLGLVISFFIYIQRFYDPLRQLASLWASFQAAMAGWERIAAILNEQSHLPQWPPHALEASAASMQIPRLEFRDVEFSYQPGRPILHCVNLRLLPGKTYALVGPTGGGKTTIACLMARLYDPTQGSLDLDGCDLRRYTPESRSCKIGFILQEPFLFDGTLADNQITEEALGPMLERFPQGLQTPVAGLSLGQRQIVAFVRAVVRQPDLLILDEATANIDTVTEMQLGAILEGLPKTTTRVVIAHRLNTIENADEIYFVNAGRVELAGSLEQALEMLRERRRDS